MDCGPCRNDRDFRSFPVASKIYQAILRKYLILLPVVKKTKNHRHFVGTIVFALPILWYLVGTRRISKSKEALDPKMNLSNHPKSIHCLVRAAAFLILLPVAFSLPAEDITWPYRDLTLNANLQLAEGKTLGDGVVLIVHGLQAHNRMELIEASQQKLHDAGLSSLAINLSLGVDNRRGFHDCSLPQRHRFDDAIGEIGAWVRWLKDNDAGDITLLGHSLGGTQLLIYAALHPDPAVRRLVLLAPATVGYPDLKSRYREQYELELDPVLERATRLVAAGKGQTLMENTDFFFCRGASVMAATFHDYYQKESNFTRIPAYLKQLQVPVLIIIGSVDERQPKILEHTASAVDHETVRLVEIDGAEHFFRDLNLDETIEHAVEFIRYPP